MPHPYAVQQVMIDHPSGFRNTHHEINGLAHGPLCIWFCYSTFILASCCIALILGTRILNRFILPLCYIPNTLSKLSDIERRSLVFHHLACFTKIIVLAGVTPAFFAVFFGNAAFDAPYIQGCNIRMRDILLVLGNLFCAILLTELYYLSDKVNPLSVAHHIMVIMIIQGMFALAEYEPKYLGASNAFYLCFEWIIYDILASAPAHAVLITHCLAKEIHPRFVRYALFCTSMWILCTSFVMMDEAVSIVRSCWPNLGAFLKIAIPLWFSVWMRSRMHLVAAFMESAKRMEECLRKRVRHGGEESEKV